MTTPGEGISNFQETNNKKIQKAFLHCVPTLIVFEVKAGAAGNRKKRIRKSYKNRSTLIGIGG